MITDKEKNEIVQQAIKKIMEASKEAGIDFMALPKTVRYLVITAYQEGAKDMLLRLKGRR